MMLKSKPTTQNPSESVVFIGDSITEFWKLNDSDFFNQNSFINKGIRSQTTSQILQRFQKDVIDLKPKTVVILAGINDIAENSGPISQEDIMNNIISMCELVSKNNIKVILCSVLPANKINWNQKIKPANKVIELNLMIKKYVLKNRISYVDYYAAMVDLNKGLQKKYGEDGVHPNKLGYEVMKEILMPYLKN